MNPLFVEWYHAIGTQVDAQELRSRWGAVEAIKEKYARGNLNESLNLIRLLNQRPVNSDSRQNFAELIHANDPSFRIRDSEFEQQILSGAILVEMLPLDPEKLGVPLALSIITASFNGHLKGETSLREDVFNAAKDYLSERTRELRMIERVIPNDDGELEDEDDEDEDEDEFEETMRAYLQAANLLPQVKNFRKPFDALKQLIEGQEHQIRRLEYQLGIQSEESNILWWMTGGYSRDFEQPMRNFGKGAAIICGKELADLTKIIPGPRSAPGILSRMLQIGEKQSKKETSLTIKDSVNVTPDTWREKRLNAAGFEKVRDFCPVHLAMEESLKLKNGNWSNHYDEVAPIKSSEQMSPLDLALQVFHETQLISLL